MPDELRKQRVASVPAARAERAPAKVNLTLSVLGRRDDGLHELESLVVFAQVADQLTFSPGGPLKLEALARRTAVPQSVLEQVMPTMRTAGIVRSERGPSGGYRLNKDPGRSRSNGSCVFSRARSLRSAARRATTPSRAR